MTIPNGSNLDIARDTMGDLIRWVDEHSALASLEEAKECALMVVRGRNAIADAEADRQKEASPLRNELGGINGRYKEVLEPLDAVLEQIKAALTRWNSAEEDKREAEAAAKFAEADALARYADATAQSLREAQDGASQGEIGTDIGSLTIAAHEASRAAGVKEREASRAARDTKVRLHTGLGNAISAHTKTVLSVDNWQHALEVLGLGDGIEAAILTAARKFKDRTGAYPPGIKVEKRREI